VDEVGEEAQARRKIALPLLLRVRSFGLVKSCINKVCNGICIDFFLINIIMRLVVQIVKAQLNSGEEIMRAHTFTTVFISTLLVACSGNHSLDQSTITFQQGYAGYSGTTDTYLKIGEPSLGDQVAVWIDGDHPLQPGVHGVLRFEIFGNMPNRIPLGSSIASATLTLKTSWWDTAKGDGGQFHRLLVPWNETSTWSSFVNGVQADGVEASVAASAFAGTGAILRPEPYLQQGDPIILDVTADVSAWSEGVANYGWAILPLPNADDGWGFWSSEYSNVVERPILVVEVMPEPSSLGLLGLIAGGLGLLVLVSGGIFFTRRIFMV
jgi:hypothetical protein